MSLLETILGRQCLASSHFLNKEFPEVIVYLESIKVSHQLSRKLKVASSWIILSIC